MTLFQRSSKWGWVKKTIPIFILAGLTAVFFSDVLFQNKIFMHRDLVRFFYPLREFSANEFLKFRIPLWNPYIHCGSPHLAELQTSVFYPLSVIYLLFSYPHAFNYFIVLHVFLAGLFTYLLMREWRYSGGAALLSAIIFMLSGYVISVINLLASLASVIWLPLVILFYERALKKDWAKNSIITGIFMALMFLGGEPAVLYATFFILLLFVFPTYAVEQVPPRRWGWSLGLAFMVFAGLASFQILPFLEFIKHTSRGMMGFNEASMWSLPPYALLDLFVPYLSESDYMYKDYWTRQSWLMVYYMGIATFIFAFISLKFDSTRRRRAIFCILASGLLLSFGRYTPVYYFLYKFLPGFSLSRYPVKFFFMVSFSMAVLAGMGLDYYKANVKSNAILARFLKGVLFFACISTFFYLIIDLKFSEAVNLLYGKLAPFFIDKKDQLYQLVYAAMFNIKRAIGYFIILSVFLFLGRHKKIRLSMIIPVLILISTVDIYTGNKRLYLNMDVRKYLEPGETVEFLKKDNGLFRMFDSPSALSQNMFVPEKDYFEGVRALKDRMVSNRGVSFKIYDAYGYGSLYNRRHEDIVSIITKSRLPDKTNLLDLLNVKYVISPKEFQADGYLLAKKGKKANIYENKNVMPRAFLADKAVVIKDEKKILERMKSKDFKPNREVILEEDLPFTSYELRVTSYKSVVISKYEPGYVEIEAETGVPRFLVLSDTYYPGWKVYVDGKKDKIYRADYILRAVYLRPGKHIVKFTYDPFSFKIGAIITLVTIFVLVYAMFFRHLGVIRH